MAASSDAAVQATNTDAAESKLSAVNKGYWEDPYIGYFAKASRSVRPPIINRGTFGRVHLMQSLVKQLLRAFRGAGDVPGPTQLISLGGGYDTLPFHLLNSEDRPSLYVELDLMEVVLGKAGVIRRQGALRAALAGPEGDEETVEVTGKGVLAPGYALRSADLRSVDGVASVLEAVGVDPGVPTVLISECVLVYMDPEHSNALLEWFGNTFAVLGAAVYEQVQPDDAFGRMMLRNIEARGCPLRSIHAFPTLDSQETRFLDLGWSHAQARTVLDLYNTLISPEERARAARCELVDELEEWNLLMSHYCIVVASLNAPAECTTLLSPADALPTSPVVVPHIPARPHAHLATAPQDDGDVEMDANHEDALAHLH